MTKIKVTLPDEVVEKYNIHDGDKFHISEKHGEIRLKKTNNTSNKRQFNVMWLVLASIIASAIFGLYINAIHLKQVPLVGNQSIASGLIVLGGLSGMIMFSTYFIVNRKNITTNYSAHTFWRTFPVIVISFVLILALALMGIAWGMGRIFTGITFGHVTAIMLFLVFVLAINYIMVRIGLAVDYGMLTTIMILVIISGAVLSMASNGKNWWQHNLSFLGTKNANNSWQFNLTLVFSSLLMVALIDYIFVSLHDVVKNSWRTITLRILLTLTALDVGAVGVFPNNANFHILHDKVAGYLVYFIIILIVGIRWLLPEVGKRFLTISYAMCIGLIVVDLMFKPFYLISLTAFELIAFVLAFGWILLLFDTMIGIVEDDGQNYQIKLKFDNKD
ncbi:AbrB/MazE/SpoVT family DNA-binding domain-containing protein [Ligilactobacillus cholophilus]|uniref:AbrB/MazE/SpoVT family DNA-binding domain-containing protein n=1 Tax=Ligilactobacillus cholophilus TaxID=3050131 RepID=UPI0025AF3ADB|nr:AbrB/MazE/SpoVT family DNA-binding domain-containing protein [Ligilactobacillus cholophilus]